jgi:hypothetical protein
MAVRENYGICPVGFYALFMGVDKSSGAWVNVKVMAIKVKIKPPCLTEKSKGNVPCTGSPKKNQFVF